MENRLFTALVALTVAWPSAQTQAPAAPLGPAGSITEISIPPGANFDKANFKMWLPAGVARVRAIAVLVPGSNGDGRNQVDDKVWQDFAVAQKVALVGCQFTDKQHDQNFIEDYVNVSKGSGQAFLDALAGLGTKSAHPELADAPLLMWGMSAGGQFNYEFTAWKPDRVAAFVVNKGGIYYSALVSRAARAVPGILFIGGKDLDSRIATITGLFAVNRRGGALWALAEEPGAAHIVGQSRDVAIAFYEDVLPLRLDPDGRLKPLSESNGFIGEIKEKTIRAVAGPAPANRLTSWFVSERVANAWLSMVTEKPH